MRKHLYIVYLSALCGLLPSLALVFYAAYPKGPVEVSDQSDIYLTSNGSVVEGGNYLGHVVAGSAGCLLILNFNQGSQQSEQLRVHLPALFHLDASSATFSSVQGTAGMSVEQPTDSQALIHLPPRRVDAHTSLVLALPPSYLQPSLAIVAASSLERPEATAVALTLSVFAVLGALLLSLLAGSRRVKRLDRDSRPSEKLSSLDLGILYWGGLRTSGITSLFLDLAQREFFDIVYRPGKITLIRRGSAIPSRSEEANLLALLFAQEQRVVDLQEIALSLREDLFSDHAATLYGHSYAGLVKKGFYEESPTLTHLRIKTLAILVQAAGAFGSLWVFFFVTGSSFRLLLVLCLLQYLFGLVFYRLGRSAAVYTEDGLAVRSQIANLHEYLSLGEPLSREEGEVFFRYLPHAAALGATGPWARRFATVPLLPPHSLVVEGNDLVRGTDFNAYSVQIAYLLGKTLSSLKDPNVD